MPVIAVGRLGDPATATAAVDSGKADFIALGRTLVADPEWVNKLRRGEPIRRCLACNTCIDGMRGGAGISCVVNGAAGRESHVRAIQAAARRAHRGDRRRPRRPDLCLAGRRRQHRHRVREGRDAPAARSAMPGRRRCSRTSAPIRQASSAMSRDMVAACARKGVTFRFGPTSRERARSAGAVRSHRGGDRRGLSAWTRRAGDGAARSRRRRTGRGCRRS